MKYLIAMVMLAFSTLAAQEPALAQASDEALAVVYNALEDPCDYAVFAETYPDSAFAPMAARRGAACGGNAPISGMPTGAPSLPAEPAAPWRRYDRTGWDTAQTDAIVRAALAEARYADLMQAARAGDGTAALIIGLARWDALGVARNRGLAVEMFEHACEAGVAHGCARLGYAYTGDGPIAEDLSQASRLLDGACAAGDLYGCAFLGYIYAVGGGGVTEDDGRAVNLYRRACDGGVEGAGCGQLGFMYANGHGVTTDHTRANQLLRRGCDAGYSVACSNLAMSYFSGRGISISDERAGELWGRACRLGNGFACQQAARHALGEWGARRDEDAAFEFLERGCAAAIDDACNRLRALRVQVQGRGAPAVSREPWIASSVEELSAACRLGDEGACVERDMRRGGIEEAIPTLRRLCEAGDAFACGRWGHTYTLGYGQDAWSATEAGNRAAGACEDGEIWACSIAASTLWPEAETSDDLQRVRHLAHRACRSEVTLGCSVYAASYVLSTIVDSPASEAEVESVLESHCEAVSPDNLGQTEPCWALSRIYQTESGVPADFDRARANAVLACASGRGLRHACAWLEENS